MRYIVRARMSTVIHRADRGHGMVTAECGMQLGLNPWVAEDAREWHSVVSVPGRAPVITECTTCFPPHIDDLSQPVTDGFRVPDPNPRVSVEHRCSRMREHIRGYGEPGSHPGDLPVPCEDCYSQIVTTVDVRWQPRRPFTAVFEEKQS